MKMERTILIGLVPMLLVATAFALYDDPAPGDPAWTIDYRGTALPEAGTDWQRFNYYGASALGTEGNDAYLRISAHDGYDYWDSTAASGWNADLTVGLTVEVKARALGAASNFYTNAMNFLAGGAQGYAYFTLLGDDLNPSNTRAIGLKGATTVYYYLDTSVWNTYRMTIEDTTAKLYINGNTTAVAEVQVSSGNVNVGRWGDSSGSGSWTHGDVDYLRATDQGAFAPVPEPAAMALLALGGLLIRKRR